MLSMTIKRITQEYIKAAINTANVVEKQIQELVEQRMYSAEYLEKEKTKLEKEVDFSMGICYYNTRLERQGKTY